VSENPAIIHQGGAIQPCPAGARGIPATPSHIAAAARRPARSFYFAWMPAMLTASPHKAMSAAIIAVGLSREILPKKPVEARDVPAAQRFLARRLLY
jgi:hypothetical protein